MRKLVVGILAHVDAGKTTLSEALLYQSGALRRLGRVDHQDAFLDTDAMERERGITIFSKQAVFSLKDTEVTLLDTPGHVDFNYEVSRSLAACEGAVLVVDASQGVEAQTLANTYLALEHDLEILPVINKVDLPAADPAGYAAALALVPCLAASRDGVRLGRGGGYYDRFLAHYKGAGLLLCPEALLLDELPCDDWDARFAPENILTEKGILR